MAENCERSGVREAQGSIFDFFLFLFGLVSDFELRVSDFRGAIKPPVAGA
jgi:hypothetical protein